MLNIQGVQGGLFSYAVPQEFTGKAMQALYNTIIPASYEEKALPN